MMTYQLPSCNVRGISTQLRHKGGMDRFGTLGFRSGLFHIALDSTNR